MKKVLRTIIFLRKYHAKAIYVTAFIVVLIGLSSHVAQAQTPDIAKLFGLDLASMISESLANFFYSFQTIASWLITLSGALLNFSINLTMHIKDFVNATPAIYTVWAAIRDLSGMFIIFALLYAAIMLITGYQDPKLGGLIKNIVMAGILINFSFFITSLAIDASNIVSLQLYSALAPTTVSSGDLKTDIGTSIKSPGLGNIFMQSLGITRLYNPNGGALTTAGKDAAGNWPAPVKIIILGITSIIIMITAALSFFLASLAFIVRFVILLFLLAFSPIVFASFVVPKMGTYATKWTDMLKSQLIFMPVYLLLMYFALSVLTSSSIFKNGYAGSLVAGGDFASDLLALGVNAALVIIMLNIPLVAAISLGAKMPGFAKGLTADAIWKKVGGFAGTNTLGKTGLNTQNYLNKKFPVFSNTLIGQGIIKNTAGKLANSGFGGGTSATATAAAAKTRGQAQQAGRTTNALNTAVKNGDHQAVGRIIGSMSNTTIAGLDKKLLKHDLVLENLDEGAHKAISANTNLSDQDKTDIHDNRINLLTSSVANAGTGRNGAIVQKMINGASGDTLAKLDDPNIAGGQAALMNDELIRHLKASHMKDMENVIGQPIRKHIGDRINIWTGFNQNKHNAHGYYTKNVHAWS